MTEKLTRPDATAGPADPLPGDTGPFESVATKLVPAGEGLLAEAGHENPWAPGAVADQGTIVESGTIVDGPVDPAKAGTFESAKLGEVAGTAPDTSFGAGEVAAKPGVAGTEQVGSFESAKLGEVAGTVPDTFNEGLDAGLAGQLARNSLEDVLEQGTIVDGPVGLVGPLDLAAEAPLGNEEVGRDDPAETGL
jgi:hypothetical protein